MRLHRLSVTAFGPFAGTEDLDFDALGEAGLFLLRGATGAGKSSLLDAVCFALYAAVPGARQGSRQALRSDHAGPDAVPKVVLEFTVGPRRLRVTRSPEYARPKKRGTGQLLVPASVLLEELRRDGWSAVATRNDEAALALDDAIGLGLTQFVTVALLPQGDFAAFLRATPTARGQLLERLFDTHRFADIESWLASRRRECAGAVEQARHALSSVIVRLDDAVACLPVPRQDGFTGIGAPDDSMLAAWDDGCARELTGRVDELHQKLQQFAVEQLAVAGEADAQHDSAARAVAQAEAVADRQATAADARAQLSRLDAEQHTVCEAAAELAAARRAAEVGGHLEALQAARVDAARADQAWQQARSRLGVQLGGQRVDGADQHDRHGADEHRPPAAAIDTDWDRRDGLAALAEALRQWDEPVLGLAAAGRQSDQLRRDLSAAEATRRELDAQLQTATSERQDAGAGARRLQEELTAAQQCAAGLDAAERAADDAEHVVVLLQRRTERADDLVALRRLHDTARRRYLELEDAVLRLRAARLSGMAAELAGGLVPGDPCPVCGSGEHPRPATSSATVTADDVEAAEARAREAATATAEAYAALVQTEAELEQVDAELQRRQVSDAETAADMMVRAVGAVATARHARSALSSLAGSVEAAVRAAEEHAQVEQSLRLELVKAQSTAAGVAQRLTAQREHVASLLRAHAATCPCTRGGSRRAGSVTDSSVTAAGVTAGSVTAAGVTAGSARVDEQPAAVAARHRHTTDAVSAAVRALEAREAAYEAVGGASSRLGHELSRLGFADASQAKAARRSDDRMTTLTQLLQEAARARAQAEALLAQPLVQAAEQLPAPDLARLRTDAGAARELAAAAQAEHAAVSQAERRVGELRGVLADAAGRLAPAQRELAVVTEVAECAAGTARSNRLRMPLSSYVLAARLEEVARLANERLDVMTAGRFSLEHTDALARRGARSGLGLCVRDTWTGSTRDASTLSGGETFLASLALALGLADAVRAEAGGLDLQTLFIDEGFGSLDDDSLDQVLDVLDGLREGGRLVGIVSHVTELRHRITAQVVVTKTARGSTLGATTREQDPAA